MLIGVLVILTIISIYLLYQNVKLSDKLDELNVQLNQLKLDAISDRKDLKDLSDGIEKQKTIIKHLDEELVAIRVRLADCEDNETDILKKLGDTKIDFETRMDKFREILFELQNSSLKVETEFDKIWLEFGKVRVEAYERGK